MWTVFLTLTLGRDPVAAAYRDAPDRLSDLLVEADQFWYPQET